MGENRVPIRALLSDQSPTSGWQHKPSPQPVPHGIPFRSKLPHQLLMHQLQLSC